MASALGSVPTVSPVYEVKFQIDTTPAGQSRTWKDVCAGFNNITEALNEVIQQYFFLCGKGFAANYVTGMAPTYTLTGVRVRGDDAQDYIFDYDVKFGLLGSRQTHAKLIRSDGTTTETVSANVTLCNITAIGGGTTDGSAVSVEIRFDGAPVEGDDWAV